MGLAASLLAANGHNSNGLVGALGGGILPMMINQARKKSNDPTAGLALGQPPKGPLSSPGMPSMPGQASLGMSTSAPPGNSLTASRGQRSPLGGY